MPRSSSSCKLNCLSVLCSVLRRYTRPDSNRRSPPVPRQGNRCRSAIDTKLKLRLTWLAQLSCQRTVGPGSARIPILGKVALRRRISKNLTRRPIGVTLKRIGLTEQFPIIPKQRPHVKSFEKFLITAINFSVTLATGKKYKAGHSILARVNLHEAATQGSFFFRLRRPPEFSAKASPRNTAGAGPVGWGQGFAAKSKPADKTYRWRVQNWSIVSPKEGGNSGTTGYPQSEFSISIA